MYPNIGAYITLGAALYCLLIGQIGPGLLFVLAFFLLPLE
jgi:hypothetical protein